MSSLFADTHNVVAILEKSDAAEGFEQIIDFLSDVTWLQALVDKKNIVISEAVIREILQLNDAEGMVCLPNEEIFAGLAQMGYEKPSTKLIFYKAFFSSQWKFLIHTILQSLSAKSTSWNKFSTATASAVICLSKGQRFNFSKYIFDSLVRNVDSSSKIFPWAGNGVARKHTLRMKHSAELDSDYILDFDCNYFIAYNYDPCFDYTLGFENIDYIDFGFNFGSCFDYFDNFPDYLLDCFPDFDYLVD
nr:hypothetical protein [Tanacetum cinerariifolium]